jgi:microcystin-dependent protein
MMADTTTTDFEYPDILPTDYIDESLDSIKARDDAAKNGFRRVSSFPSVTADNVGMKVYLVGKGNYQLTAADPEPEWVQLNEEGRSPAYTDWVRDNYQPISKLLTSLAKLTEASNALPYFNGPEDMQSVALTGYIKNLLACSDNDEVIELLKLGTMAKLSYPINGSYIAEGTLPKSAISEEFKSALGWSTGDMKLTYKTTADDGWVLADDGSIGNAMSGATSLASADCYDLFMLMWDNDYCTLQSFSGSTSTKTTAIQDWTANKRLILPKVLGRALGVAGSGSGLTTRGLGATVGEETTTLGVDNIPAHTHGIRTSSSSAKSNGGSYASGYICQGFSKYSDNFSTYTNAVNNNLVTSTGSSSSTATHNNMPPTAFVNVMIKL